MTFVGVISDSHGDVDSLQRILERLEGAEAVLYLGDMMTLRELDALKRFEGKVVRVHGDHDWAIRHSREGHVAIHNDDVVHNTWKDHLNTRGEIDEKDRMMEWMTKTKDTYQAGQYKCVLVHGALDGYARGMARRQVLAKTNEELNYLWADIDDYATAAKNMELLEQEGGSILLGGHEHQGYVWTMPKGTAYLDVVRDRSLVQRINVIRPDSLILDDNRLYVISVPPAHHTYDSWYGVLYPEDKKFEYKNLG